MSKVLVTGFGPYGVTPVNPAQLTAEELDGRTIAGATVISRYPAVKSGRALLPASSLRHRDGASYLGICR